MMTLSQNDHTVRGAGYVTEVSEEEGEVQNFLTRIQA